MRFHICATIALAFSLIACSGESFPETHPVTGTVTYRGRPVGGANVSLVSADPGGRSAGGVTDAEGNFSVTTYFTPEHQPEGVLPGSYSITVSKFEVPEIPKGLSLHQEQDYLAKLGPPKSLLPKAYQNPNTSGLKVTIGDAPPQPLELALKD